MNNPNIGGDVIYSPAWPHGEIKQIFPKVFFVTGTNKTHYAGKELQHSRNMIIIRNNEELTLINTVRLDKQGLDTLESLGKISNIVRIGAFHGRDDAFYLDNYHAKLWALPNMINEKDLDFELVPDGKMPFADCDLFVFETSKYPEGILLLKQEGGILITCDSVKNWLSADQFFSEETAKSYRVQDFFGSATISSIWRQACQVQISDFEKIMQLTFAHLLSAHGEPLYNEAYERLKNSILKISD